jgi:hypothetical protein
VDLREQRTPDAGSLLVPLGGFESFAAFCRARRFDDLGEIRIEASAGPRRLVDQRLRSR